MSLDGSRSGNGPAKPRQGHAPLEPQTVACLQVNGPAPLKRSRRRSRGSPTRRRLARAGGVPIRVKVSRAGKVKLSGTVPARTLRRTGRAVVVVTGSATAQRAGTVTVRARLTAAGRRHRARLKGARLTLRVSQLGLTTSQRVVLR